MPVKKLKKKEPSEAQRVHLQKHLEWAIWDVLSSLKDMESIRSVGFNEGRFEPIDKKGRSPKKDELGIKRTEYVKVGNELARKARRNAKALRLALLKAKKLGLLKEDFI